MEYEPDTDLRDTEQIPLQKAGGVEAFLRREVLPYAADAWYQADSVKVGYEISFTRYFYKPKADADAAGNPWPISWRWRRRRRGCWVKFSTLRRNSNEANAQSLPRQSGSKR